MKNGVSGLKIKVKGIVQGVGFRPFVYSLAIRLGITGWVCNTSGGVDIEIHGNPHAIQEFLQELKANPPVLARIDHMEHEPCWSADYPSFNIIASHPDPGSFIPVSPDVAICSDCQKELFDPVNRRYRYPFINCTNCGPRFSIIRDIPYDRPATTMVNFPMCPDCRQEYDNPLDRRFHAQPVACSTCGPKIWLEVNGNIHTSGESSLQAARQLLMNGRILAVKGLGGFHMACDATNEEAVSRLRERKRRSNKPFALMAFNLIIIRQHCHVTSNEENLLLSPAHPIVLLESLSENSIASETAPGQHTLGFMLPYTPLHVLLLEPAPGFSGVLVMTSGNQSEEPIAYEDEQARVHLAGLSDGFLMHDRPIHMRVDDSVFRISRSQHYPIRRSRGYAPDPIILPQNMPPILAVGAELKNTFCLTRDKYAFISHHVGDMENFETLRSFELGIEHFERLFRIHPESLACDLHPDYLATKYAQQRAEKNQLHLVAVQHHHAHLSACLADNGWDTHEPAIGLCYDGTGFGSDGAIWGGEALIGGYRAYRRAYHLDYVPMPGGDASVRKPARMAFAHLLAAGIHWDADLPPAAYLSPQEQHIIKAQMEHKIQSPLTSSMGRLFDTAAALLGICHTVSYEGEAAIMLEALADPNEQGSYKMEIQDDLIMVAALWKSLIHDWREGNSIPILSARFHNSIARLNLDLCCRLSSQTGIQVVALSGGVWQNRMLLEQTVTLLEGAGLRVFTHHQIPTNDGGISLGQAMIAAAEVHQSGFYHV